MTAIVITPVTNHDRRRLRVTWAVVGGGLLLGIIGAASLAMLGLDGRAGFAAVVLGAALGCVVAALVTVVLAILDELRRIPVATRRVVVALGLFAAAALLLLMVSALAAANA